MGSGKVPSHLPDTTPMPSTPGTCAPAPHISAGPLIHPYDRPPSTRFMMQACVTTINMPTGVQLAGGRSRFVVICGPEDEAWLNRVTTNHLRCLCGHTFSAPKSTGSPSSAACGRPGMCSDAGLVSGMAFAPVKGSGSCGTDTFLLRSRYSWGPQGGMRAVECAVSVTGPDVVTCKGRAHSSWRTGWQCTLASGVPVSHR